MDFKDTNIKSSPSMADQDACMIFSMLFLARSYVYCLANRLLGGRPSPAFAEELFSDMTLNALEELSMIDDALRGCYEAFRELSSVLSTDELARGLLDEHSRLFENLGDAPICLWEGAALSGDAVLFQPNVLDVRKRYAKHGLRMKRFKRVPEDHLAAMAHFVGILSVRTYNSIRKGDFNCARGLVADQYSFEQDHMACWLPRCKAQMVESENFPIHASMIGLIAALVEFDLRYLGDALVWIDEKVDCAPEVAWFDTPSLDALIEAERRIASMELFGIEAHELQPTSCG